MTDSKKTKTTETKTTHTRVLKRTSADGETKKHHHSSHTKDSHLSSTKKKTFTPKNIKEDMEAKVDAFFEMNKESGIRKLVSATKLMEAGAHLGLPPKSWNPKMQPYIYNKKHSKHQSMHSKIQIIDIIKTLVLLDHTYNFLRDISRDGGKVLFVGTQGQITKEHIKEEAKRVKSYYVNQRWLGGTLTNFKVVSKSIEKLNNLMSLLMSDEIKKYAKKEQVVMNKTMQRLEKFLGGIRTLRGLPHALFVTDPVVEFNAVMEARKLKIPVVALANVNANPDLIDFIIPVNTNSSRAVWLLSSILADAIAEAHGEPQLIVGKKDEEIILPEIVKKDRTQDFIRHKKFTKGASSETTEQK